MISVNALLSSRNRTNVYDRVVSFKNHLETEGLANFRLIHRVDGRTLDLLRFLTFSIENVRSDLVHVFEPLFPNSPVNVVLEKLLDKPIILDTGDVHWAYAAMTGASSMEMMLLRLMEKIAMKSSAKIIVRGRGHLDLLTSAGINPDRIAWIPDGVDFDLFSSRESRVRKKLDLEGKIVVGYVGTLRSIVIEGLTLGRGWEIIKAIRKLAASGRRDVVALIVGDGPAMPVLIDETRKEGVTGRVAFTGKVSYQMTPEYINAMDICFVDSYNSIAYKAMINTKLLQYMACAKPIVAGNIGEAAYSVPGCGILIRPCIMKKRYLTNYVAEITNALELLIDDPQLRSELGREASIKALDLYDWKKLSNRLFDLYVEILENS